MISFQRKNRHPWNIARRTFQDSSIMTDKIRNIFCKSCVSDNQLGFAKRVIEVTLFQVSCMGKSHLFKEQILDEWADRYPCYFDRDLSSQVIWTGSEKRTSIAVRAMTGYILLWIPNFRILSPFGPYPRISSEAVSRKLERRAPGWTWVIKTQNLNLKFVYNIA